MTQKIMVGVFVSVKMIRVETKELKDGWKYKIQIRYAKANVALSSSYIYRTEKSAKDAAWRFIDKNGFKII